MIKKTFQKFKKLDSGFKVVWIELLKRTIFVKSKSWL
jgi:hypothetical protein